MPVDAPLTSSVLAVPVPAYTPAGSWTAEFRTELRRSARAHSVLFAIVLLYVVAALLVPALLGQPNRMIVGTYVEVFLTVTIGFAVIFALAYPFHVALFVRPDDPAGYLIHQLRYNCFSPRRLCSAIPVLIMIPIAMSCFTWLKVLIPSIQPFAWDARLAEIDRWLHGGHDPWELLQPLIGFPAMTSGITFLYHLWIFVMCGVLLWQALSVADERRRMQYLVTLVLLWMMIGNVAATVLSSAGPVYFGRVTGLPDPFAPLMAYLHAADRATGVMALEVQNILWQSYLEQGAGIGRGISAMPSMHLASSFSFVLIGFASSRRLGIAFGLFCAVILVGSVHLGWHYAIDGYVAIAMTWLVWLAVGWLLKRPAVASFLWPEPNPAQ